MKLVSLGYQGYADYIGSPHWVKVKAAYRGSELPQDCAICGCEEVDLHHLTYERVGAEELSDLSPLCRTCHDLIHVLEARGDVGLDFKGLVNEERAAQQRIEVGKREYLKKKTREDYIAWCQDIRDIIQEKLGPQRKNASLTGCYSRWAAIMSQSKKLVKEAKQTTFVPY